MQRLSDFTVPIGIQTNITIQNITAHLTQFKTSMVKENRLKANVEPPDHKYRRLLLSSVICSTLSYSVLVLLIARAYQDAAGKHLEWLLAGQGWIVIVMGSLKFHMWRHINSGQIRFGRIVSLIGCNVVRLVAQRKLIVFYLIEVTLSLALASAFFFADHKGLFSLLKLTAPVTIVTYILGLYFIVAFTSQIKKFSRMGVQANHLYLTHISKN